MKDLNRLKIVLVEKKKTSKWLAEQLGKNASTVSSGVLTHHNQTSRRSTRLPIYWGVIRAHY
jgi:hypothetical protein